MFTTLKGAQSILNTADVILQRFQVTRRDTCVISGSCVHQTS